jgi:hypothetical protein
MLKEEADVREREAEELRLAAGSFPALSGSGDVGAGVSTRGGGLALGFGHRVLLVDSRTKRVKVESYSRSGGLESEEMDVAEAEAGIDDERVPPPLGPVHLLDRMFPWDIYSKLSMTCTVHERECKLL